MMVMPCSRALGTAEQDVACIVDEFGGNIGNGIVAVVFLAFFHFLQGCFALPERFARLATLATILTFGQVGRKAIFLLVDVDASLALQNEPLVTHFSDEVLAGA